MRIDIKVKGEARVVHRCALCGQPINGDPIFLHRDGLVAVHADCHQKEK